MGKVAERVNRTSQKFGDSSEKTFDKNPKSSESRFGKQETKSKNVGRTAQKIIDLVISDPSITAEATFGTAKRVYRANDIRAKLPETAATWIAVCFFVKNLKKFLQGLLCLFLELRLQLLRFSRIARLKPDWSPSWGIG